MARLFGFTSADVATDAGGNVLPGRSATVWYEYAGGDQFTDTYSVNADLSQGSRTGGIVTADSNGRLVFFADFDGTLWLEFDGGGRWPLNPLKVGDVVQTKVDSATSGLSTRVDAAAATADAAKASAGEGKLPAFGDMPHPYVSAHRGGSYIVPEGTRVGRLNAYGLGMQVIDGGDIHATLDGVLYDCHDTTLDRTTNLTGEIAKTPSMRVAQGKIDCSQWFGGGWADQPITSIIDTLDDLGGKVYLTLEVKTDVDSKYAQKIVDLIKARGLTKQILIASFDEGLLQPAIAAGHEVMLLGTSMTTVASDTGLASRGVRYVGGSANTPLTPDTAKTLMNNGLRVVTYSTTRHAQVNGYRSGASGELWGYISDDPYYLRGHVDGTYAYRLTSDPFASLTYYHGHQPDNADLNPASRGTFVANSGGAFFCAPVALQRRAWLQGWASPLVKPSTYTITYEQDYLNGATSAGGALVFGCPDDAPFDGDNTAGGGIGNAPGYMAWFFSSGLMRVFRRDPGVAPVNIGEFQGATVTPGTPTKLSVSVSGSTITFKNVTTGSTVTATDSKYRGGYVHLLANDNGANAGVRWRNIAVS